MKVINTLHKRTRLTKEGFTILELLIATVVFSIILLVVTYGLLQIGKSYYKGVNISKTQNVARTISDSISQSIQFSSNKPDQTPPSGSQYSICAGTKRFIVNRDHQLVGDGSDFALRVEDNAGNSCPNTAPGAVSQEILSPHMRVASFDIAPVGGSTSIYSITVRVVYGDDDLLNAAHDSCMGGGGNQYCAVSELKSTVQRRIIN